MKDWPFGRDCTVTNATIQMVFAFTYFMWVAVWPPAVWFLPAGLAFLAGRWLVRGLIREWPKVHLWRKN